MAIHCLLLQIQSVFYAFNRENLIQADENLSCLKKDLTAGIE